MKNLPLGLTAFFILWLHCIVQGQSISTNKIKCIAIGPNNSYVVVYGRNAFYSLGISNELYQKLLEYNKAGEEIKQVVLTKDGGYIILRGYNGYSYNGISEELGTIIKSYYPEGKELNLKYSLIFGQCL